MFKEQCTGGADSALIGGELCRAALVAAPRASRQAAAEDAAWTDPSKPKKRDAKKADADGAHEFPSGAERPGLQLPGRPAATI